LVELKLGDWFKNYYLLAMGGAIWSTPTNGMLDFPARSFIRFFDNHGLITINDQPQWYTVTGGSREYVKKLTASFKDKIKLNCGASKVERNNGKITVHDTNGGSKEFDNIIFACHSDQAMKITTRPNRSGKKQLSAQ
jgi:predicted NAD/FAD-binding protein